VKSNIRIFPNLSGKMKPVYPVLLFLPLFIFITTGCNPNPLPSNKLGANPPIEEIFRDDFSNPDSGWPTMQDNGSIIGYQFEGLRFIVNQPNYDYWSALVDNYQNVRIAVEAAKLGGPDDNGFGVICRLKDKDNFYAFLISSDGYAGIIKVKEGNYSILSGSGMQYYEAIRKGGARNDLLVGCIGPLLTFSVNGESILETTDDEYTSGRAGLFASSGATAGVEIFFDNFVLSNP